MPKSYAPPPESTSLIRKMGETFEHSARDFKGTPLFELLSLKVGCHNFIDIDTASGYNVPHLEIYGRIELIDDNQKKFFLFRRKKSEAKAVFLHNPSNSSDPTNPTTSILNNFDMEGPHCVCPKFRLKFCLKDRRQNVTLFDDYKDVDCTLPVLYDKVQTYWFHTKDLWVSFDFVLLRCALVANVGIIVDKKDKSPENINAPAQLRGSITTATKMSDLSSIKRLVLDGSEELVLGILNNLASFAVPSYSFLEFEVNLEANGDKISHLSKFEPEDWFQVPYEDEFYVKAYHIRLIVEWGLGERFLPEYLSSELQYDTSKKGKLIDKEQHPLYRCVSDNRCAYMEIFSISVCFYGDDGCKGLTGKIEACDEDEDFVLFNGVLEDHKSNELISLTGPRRSYRGDYFLVDVKLKDREGREISSGCVGYNCSNMRVHYNMRMCSIIRGKHGCAAVHYTVFVDAIQSKLKFTLEPVTLCDRNYEVYGKIAVSYSSYKYATHYQKKYYRSVLFKKGREEAVKLGVLPLSHSVVAVPLNGSTSLIVSVKLHVLLNGNHVETVQYVQSFNPRSPKSTPFKKTRDESTTKKFRFRASIKWTRFNI